jgi:thiol:disulfide interchange protein DsbC
MLKQGLMVLSMVLAVSLQTQADDVDALKAKLKETLPDANIEQLKAIDNTGLYEGVINGEVLYFTADGRYVMQGDLVSLETRSNVTEQRRVSLRKAVIDDLDEKDMIIFEPKKTKYTLTVFTDIDCGYCRKLHSEMQQYNDLGIRIRYMAFPRGGLESESYDDAVNVWCAKDRQKAMTQAKSGKQVAELSCDNPVKEEFETGQMLGVRGTPSIFLENGQMLPGYVAPKKLRSILDEHLGQS